MFAVFLGLRATGVAHAAPSESAGSASDAACVSATVVAPIVADTWLDENSPSSAKGSDSVLSVEGGSMNVDTGVVSGRARALFRFAMPSAVPQGCVVESARLSVFSSEETAGERAEAVRLAAAWSENGASWSNQPGTVGDAVRIWSRDGYMQWNVTAQVRAMLDAASTTAFSLRTPARAPSRAGGSRLLQPREGRDRPPELVIRFAARRPGSRRRPHRP